MSSSSLLTWLPGSQRILRKRQILTSTQAHEMETHAAKLLFKQNGQWLVLPLLFLVSNAQASNSAAFHAMTARTKMEACHEPTGF
jgi:hypothetical protein